MGTLCSQDIFFRLLIRKHMVSAAERAFVIRWKNNKYVFHQLDEANFKQYKASETRVF